MKWVLFQYWPIQLLCLGIIAKFVCAGVLVWRGLARRYPGLTLFLAGGASQSSYLLWSGFHSRTGYYDAYRDWNWIILALWGMLAVEIFVVIARHFPFTSFSLALLACLAGGGFIAGEWLMAPGAWLGPVGEHLAWTWKVLAAAGVLMIGGWVAFRLLADFRFRRNAQWTVSIAAGLLACHLVGSERARRSGTADRWTQGSITGGSLVAACLWAWRLRRDGEEFKMPPPDPAKLLQSMGGINAIREQADKLRGADGGSAPLSGYF